MTTYKIVSRQSLLNPTYPNDARWTPLSDGSGMWIWERGDNKYCLYGNKLTTLVEIPEEEDDG